MKKVVSSLLAAACIATMSVGVMADVPDYAPTSSKYTVEVTEGLNNGTRYGFLVLNTDALTSTISEDSIMYIDQATAANGKISFPNFIPKTELAKDSANKYYVFLGGEGYNATQIATLSAAQSVKAESITLDKTAQTLRLNGTFKLTATVLPAETEDKTVTWSVKDNSTVVTVDQEGNVTAGAATGEAIVIATTSNGKTAECVVTVTDGVPGDMNADGYVTKADAILLGKHAALPSRYEIEGDGDTNCDGYVTKADAILLGKHAALPSRYPIYQQQAQ